MKNLKPKNIAASIRLRLLNIARETNRPFSELLQYFAMERFLYRLSKSPYVEKFVLKGALMLTVWKAPLTRPTMDIDMHSQASNSIDIVVAQIQDVCRHDVEPDGIIFDAASVSGERIVEDTDYEGIRTRFRCSLDTAQVVIQADIGLRRRSDSTG